MEEPPKAIKYTFRIEEIGDIYFSVKGFCTRAELLFGPFSMSVLEMPEVDSELDFLGGVPLRTALTVDWPETAKPEVVLHGPDPQNPPSLVIRCLPSSIERLDKYHVDNVVVSGGNKMRMVYTQFRGGLSK